MNHSNFATSADGLEQVMLGSNGEFLHLPVHPTMLNSWLNDRGIQKMFIQDNDQNVYII